MADERDRPIIARTRDGRPVTRRAFDPDHPEEPYVNEHGVVIGDNFYDSEHSPLNRWSEEIDPQILSGDQWVHPQNDIGWKTPANQALLEENAPPTSGIFMHPMEDTSARAEADDLTPGERIELQKAVDFPGKRKNSEKSTPDDSAGETP